MLGISLDQARNLAVVGATAPAICAVASFWVMKSFVQKLLVASLLVLLAFATWSQRVSLQECADKVQGNFARARTDATVNDTTCTFFGFDVNLS